MRALSRYSTGLRLPSPAVMQVSRRAGIALAGAAQTLPKYFAQSSLFSAAAWIYWFLAAANLSRYVSRRIPFVKTLGEPAFEHAFKRTHVVLKCGSKLTR